jgi:hypothetical protein
MGVFMQSNKVSELVDEFHELASMTLFIACAINIDSEDEEKLQAGRYNTLIRIANSLEQCNLKLESFAKYPLECRDSSSEKNKFFD